MREVLASGGCAAGGGAAKGAVSQLADQILGPRPMMGRGPQVMNRPPPAHHIHEYLNRAARPQHPRGMPASAAEAAFMKQQNIRPPMMGPRGPMMAPRGPSDAWARQFQQQQRAAPHAAMEAAWASAPRPNAMEAAWRMQHQHQRAQQEMAWRAAQQRDMTMRAKMAQPRAVPVAPVNVEDERTKLAAGEGNTVVPGDLEAAWKSSATAKQNMEAAWKDSTARQTLEAAFAAAPRSMDEAWQTAAAGNMPFQNAWNEAVKTNEYAFKDENQFKESKNPFEEGMALFKAGELHDAILAFQADVQQNDDSSEGWRMLGHCHAENDDDRKAILCLEKSLDRNNYNLKTLLALGVSYVNEMDHTQALKSLKTWVQHNPKFMGMEVQKDMYSDGTLMDEVMQLMLQAERHSAGDPGVQEVLGVLYNVTRDFDHAVEAFKTGISQSPDDYAMWNKLGATLANSDRSAQAIPAYHRALELKPKYARGWLNLGISHANLSDYAKAARCYLTALSLNPKATHIWSYTRICFSCMGRPDLATKAKSRDVRAFANDFEIPFLPGGGGGGGMPGAAVGGAGAGGVGGGGGAAAAGGGSGGAAAASPAGGGAPS